MKRIRLGSLESQDKLMWNENKAQTFFMRIAYKVQTVNIKHSMVQEEKRVWNGLWKLSIPPKLQNFMWWANLDILPT